MLTKELKAFGSELDQRLSFGKEVVWGDFEIGGDEDEDGEDDKEDTSEEKSVIVGRSWTILERRGRTG